IRSVNSDFTFIGAQVNRGGINGIESKNYKRRSASFVSDCVAVKRLDSFWAGNGCFNFIAFIQTYDFVDNTVFRVFVIAIMNKICKRNFLGCDLQGWLVYGRLVTVLALIVTRLFGPLVTRLLTVFSVVDAKSGRYPSVLRAIGSNGIFAIFDIVRNLDFNFEVAVIVSLSLLGVHCTIIGMYRDIYVTFWREAST